MTDPIALIISLTGCLEEDARRVLGQVDGDVVEAVDRIVQHVPCPSSKVVPPPRKHKREDMTSDEEYLNNLRSTMKQMDDNIQSSIASNQRADAVSVATPAPLEETVQQNNCSQECHLPSIEEGVRTLGIASQ